ncbi:restriction endonuclease subunit S [Bifidobacterium adolescentis]|uniref:Restriction endonuclease subunit S n=2 Tax=Bifidobacterium adolescentis TaxID=1680 RepID=A0A7J5NAI8_BIFAD|nr:restriction endonuclease subunit S [Bifidobacterium adolescentis]KAB5858764.1 restriction endonuclease subunit S [Bifidobacterium adolescentis]KAB5872143.1 restriction endonuclease subunit S [Bifidobacterium adolescentis]KAB5887215.1 restriction endonuclease subunit S [Bifidobacterium adolescentis]
MAEQHEKALVPQIRFTGFTDPWEQRKLGEVASGFEYGLNAAASDFDGEKKYLRITDIDDQTREFRTDDLSSPDINNPIDDRYLLKEGDILFARTGASVGKTYLYKASDGKTYYAGFLIRAHVSDEADAGFIFQSTLTERYKQFVLLTSQRSGQPGINAQEYSDLLLPLPSLMEQRRIGAFFDRLDSLITLHQRKYDKLCVLKKSMLDKMFPKGGSLYPEIRFAGFTDPWEQRKLGEIAAFGGGHTPSMSDPDNYEGGNVLWVTSQDVKSYYLDGTTTQITEKGAKELTLYPMGALVMVTRSGILRHTLPVAELCKPSTVNQDIRVILPQEDKCCGKWLLQFFISRNKELLLEFGKTGTTVESVDFSKMKDMILRMPSLSEQRQIGLYFARLDNLITLHQRKLELLRNIKKSMLDKMFV